MSDEMSIMVKGKEQPFTVPMAMLRPHEKQAMRNHGQTLERLNQRGGLCASEALGIMDGKSWGELRNDHDQCLIDLRERVDAFRASLRAMRGQR